MKTELPEMPKAKIDRILKRANIKNVNNPMTLSLIAELKMEHECALRSHIESITLKQCSEETDYKLQLKPYQVREDFKVYFSHFS